MSRLLSAVLLAASLLAAAPLFAQGSGAIRYSEAVRRPVRQTVTLPGSVESLRESVIASEVMGLVRKVAVQPGDRVRRGALLVQLDTDWLKIEKDAAASDLQVAQAQLDLSRRRLKRAQELFDGSIISQNEYDTAVSERTRWEGEVQRADAQIRRNTFLLEHSSIRAPFNGAIVRKRTEPGQWVTQGGPVMEMVATGELEVAVDVPERYFDLLAGDVSATVTLESVTGLTLDGVVTGIVPRADARARTFPIKIRIDNPDGRVGVGMLARVDLPVGGRGDELLVPKDALVRDIDGAESVYRIDGESMVQPVPVRSGQGYGVWVAVTSGPLQPGDRVVTRGNERLQPGQQVEATPLEYPLP